MSESLEQRLRDGLRKAADFEPRTAQARARFQRLSRRRQARARIRTASLAAVGATLVLGLAGGVGMSQELRDRLGLGDAAEDWNIGIVGTEGTNESSEQPEPDSKAGADSVTEEGEHAGDSKSDSNGAESTDERTGSGGEPAKAGSAGSGDTAPGGEIGSTGKAGSAEQGTKGADGKSAESGSRGDTCVANSGGSDAGQGTASGEGGAAEDAASGATPAPNPSPSPDAACEVPKN